MSEDFSFGPSQADVEAMAAELQQRRLADWQREAVTAHPGAAPFADLLVAGSKGGVLELAADIANRHQPQPAEDEPSRWDRAQAARNAATPEQSTHQPNAPTSGDDLDGAIAAEVKRLRDNPGESWSKLIQLKQDAAMRQAG